MNEHECERTLRVQIGPSLQWDRQFREMVHKMKEATAKLKNITIAILVVHMFFNMYLLMKVYFGYSIISITNQ